MNITIKTIPHDMQRYPTVGDWYFDDAGNLEIRVSDMGNWQYEALVAFHELAEVLLCKDRGITAEMVDVFCMTIEERQKEGTVDESGHDRASPSHREHIFAENVERLLAFELGIDWNEYGGAIP